MWNGLEVKRKWAKQVSFTTFTKAHWDRASMLNCARWWQAYITCIIMVWPIHCALQQQYHSTMYYSPLCYSVCKSLLYAHLEHTNFTAQPVHSIGESLVWNGIPPIPLLLQWDPRVETSSCGITMCWIRELSYRGWDEAGLWSEEYTVQNEDKKYLDTFWLSNVGRHINS